MAAKQQETPLDVEDSQPVKVGGIDAWRVEASAVGRSGHVRAQLTFIPFHDATWRITGRSAGVRSPSRHEARCSPPRAASARSPPKSAAASR